MSDDWPVAGTLLAFRYRLVSRLEIGGMAEIWHAQDELLGRPVALKLSAGPDRSRTDALRLAWREARMGARLSHPNVAAVHDYDEAVRPEGSVAPFVVLELLAGETVAARLARAPLPWREAAAIGAAVAGALTAAHAGGVVHRDVKPGNVMLTPTGVKILDFGISAVAGEPDDDETGATFGTPAYVAPERLDGKPAEPATDVYGLGVLLFEMLTGQPPYPVDTWEELATARAGGAPGLPPTLPPALRELVTRCLADEPDRRPTAAAVGDGLAALIAPAPANWPSAAPAPGPPPPGPQDRLGTGRAAPGRVNGSPPDDSPTSSPTGGPAGHPSSGPTGSRPPGGDPGESPASGPAGGDPSGSPAGGTAPGSAAGRDGGDGRPGTRRRRLVLWSSLVALAVSVVAVVATLGSSWPTVEAGRSPAASSPPASPAPPPPTTASAAPRAALRTATPLDVDVALARFRTAVETGRAEGRIRPDVAVDLLNLLQSVDGADPREADRQVAELRRKLRDRVGEGSVDSDSAETLRSRLADLHTALSSG